MAPKYAMSDSESEPDQAAPSIPSDEALERSLRDAVAQVYKSGKMEELTVKRVRLAAEKSLGIDEGFFKGDSNWKAKSEEIIRDEVQVQDEAPKDEDSDDEKEPSPPPKPSKPTKRTKSDAPSKSKKRQKTSPPESEEEKSASAAQSEESEEEVKKPAKKQSKPAPKKTKAESSKDKVVSDESDVADEEESKPAKEDVDETKEDSESEMSVVLDEEPNPKPARKRKSADAPAKKATKTATKKAPAKGKDASLDPDQAEIKRLQGWLLKCGIRKMWARELAPYDTAKAKIKHLKEMLKDAGMEGRYSLDKANKIREERELKADLELIQEGAKQWGKGSKGSGDEAEDSEGTRPRRRLARGRKSLAFLEEDGEETD